MNGFVRLSLASALLLAAFFMVSCGASSNRVLESISVSPAVGNGQVQYVATGTFSAPPVKVTPLPVNWMVPAPLGLCMPAGCTTATITSQGLATCGTLGQLGSVTVTASAPADPKLPLNSTGVPLVSGTATLGCP